MKALAETMLGLNLEGLDPRASNMQGMSFSEGVSATSASSSVFGIRRPGAFHFSSTHGLFAREDVEVDTNAYHEAGE